MREDVSPLVEWFCLAFSGIQVLSDLSPKEAREAAETVYLSL